MGRINIEIPDDLHQQLRVESSVKNVPIKMIAIKALNDHVEQTELEVDGSVLEA